MQPTPAFVPNRSGRAAFADQIVCNANFLQKSIQQCTPQRRPLPEVKCIPSVVHNIFQEMTRGLLLDTPNVFILRFALASFFLQPKEVP